jgi:hypothetical protein
MHALALDALEAFVVRLFFALLAGAVPHRKATWAAGAGLGAKG